MKTLSAKNLEGEVRDRWVRARREMYRGILRDPRSSEAAKEVARSKLDATKAPRGSSPISPQG